MAAWLSSAGISHLDLLPHIPSISLSTVSSSPHPGIAPQSLNSPPSCCPFQETCIPAQSMYGCGKDCLILIPFRLPQISYFTLSLKYFSFDLDSCPAVGIGPLLQFPHQLRVGPVLLTLLFSPPSSFVLLSFAWFYIYFFHWSSSPVRSQLVFCMHFCD